MNNSFIYFISIVAGIFSLIAGIMAFLISQNEYSQHFKDKKESIKLSLQTAIFTFIFLFSLTVIVGLIIYKSVS